MTISYTHPHDALCKLLNLLFFISLFLLPFTQAKAQSFDKGVIKGSLVNEEKLALSDATVFLRKSSDSGIYKTALSDSLGIFSFKSVRVGDYFVEVSMMGFGSVRRMNIPVSERNEETDLGVLILASQSKKLGEVVVRAQVPLIEKLIDKTVVNVENSILSEGTTALEVLDRLPGVQVDQGAQITLNGRSGVTVFLDGKATLLSSEDLANLLRGMASSSIQKIEIMTKPSAKFDAAGNGGIINIVRKRNRKEGLNGSVNAGYTQSYYGSYNGGVSLSLKNKGYNLLFGFTYLDSKIFDGTRIASDVLNDNNTLETRQLANNNSSRFTRTWSPSLGAEFYLSKRTTLSVSGIGGFQFADTKNYSKSNDQDMNFKNLGSQDFRNLTEQKPFNYIVSTHLDHQIDTSGKGFSADLDYSHYWSDANQHITNEYYDAAGDFIKLVNTTLDQDRKLNIYAAKFDYYQPLRKNGRLELGWKSSYVKIDNDNRFYNIIGEIPHIDSSQSDYTINKENINAAYVNINKEYGKLALQAGLRAEHTVTKGRQLYGGQPIDRNYVQLFPSLFLDYKINERHGLNFKISRRTDRPVYSQLNPFRRPLSPTLYFQGNPNLRPEVSINSELTYSFNNELFFTIGYNIYQDYIGNIPFLDSNRVTVTRMPSNINGSYYYNFDILYSKKLASWWSTNSSVSVYQQSFNGEADNFSLDNKGILSYVLDLNQNFTINKTLSAECNFQMVSKRRVIARIFGGYQILSFGVKQMVLGNRGSIVLKLNNILQTQDEGSTYYYKNIYQAWYINFYTRAASVNFTYRFGKGKAGKLRTVTGSADEQRRSK